MLLVLKDLVLDLENEIPGMYMSRRGCLEQGKLADMGLHS